MLKNKIITSHVFIVEPLSKLVSDLDDPNVKFLERFISAKNFLSGLYNDLLAEKDPMDRAEKLAEIHHILLKQKKAGATWAYFICSAHAIENRGKNLGTDIKAFIMGNDLRDETRQAIIANALVINDNLNSQLDLSSFGNITEYSLAKFIIGCNHGNEAKNKLSDELFKIVTNKNTVESLLDNIIEHYRIRKSQDPVRVPAISVEESKIARFFKELFESREWETTHAFFKISDRSNEYKISFEDEELTPAGTYIIPKIL